MVCIKRTSNAPYTIEYSYSPISEIANEAKSIPREWINDDGNDINPELIEYLRPLIRLFFDEGMQKMELGEPDASGRRRPVPVEGATYELATDLAIVALGTRSNPILLEATEGLEKTERGYIKVDEATGETSLPNVFAGGDIVTGAATVILAMGAGRRAGQEICRRLLG